MMPAARCSDQFWPGALTPTTRCGSALLREEPPLRRAKRRAGGNEVLADEGLPRIALAGPSVASTFEAITMIPFAFGVLGSGVEGVVVDDRGDQRVGLARERRLHVGDLLLDRSFGLGEDHLAIGLDLGAGVVEALLHRLPERVRRARNEG